MEMKLKELRRKENDIGEFERDKKVKMEMEQYEQGINYTEAKFFSTCEEEFRKIANDAEREQKTLKEREKIKRLKKKQNEKESNVSEMLMLNIIIDYLRSNNINYSYSVLMREKNIINEDLVMKSQLASLFNLKEEFDNDHKFNVSLLELIINKLEHFNELINNKKLSTNEFSIQCELITSQNNHNNLLLTEIKLQEIRNQTEIREKKHFESQLHLFKSQELLKLKTDMEKLFQNKEQQLSQKYETKIQSLINENTQSSPHENHTKKLEQYLNEINTLKEELRSQKERSIKLEIEKLEHDCFQNEQIQNKIEQIETERKQLSQLKSEFELALRNMGTKVEDLALQKQKIMENGKKETEEYLNKNKIYRENKDYMIEKVYSTLKSFEIRIDHLSVDNNKLYQENEILKKQLNSLKLKDEELKKLEETKRHLSISDLKVPTKNASIGVTPEEFQNNELEESKLQSEKSILTYTSEEFQDKMKERTQQNERINKLKLEMSLLKNKVKYLVMDFE